MSKVLTRQKHCDADRALLIQNYNRPPARRAYYAEGGTPSLFVWSNWIIVACFE